MNDFPNIEKKVSRAVRHFWLTRNKQSRKQGAKSGARDAGARTAVTAGAQMDGFINLLTELIHGAGVDRSCIFHSAHLELPGYFRPTKEWDLLVVKDNQLIAAIEAKSQVGPSFGNNFNNRTEEAIGSAVDLWTAFREGGLHKGIAPWLGFIFLLEECPESLRPVKVSEPHFKVFPEFKEASYARRYELLCKKLIRERHYSASAFLTSSRTRGARGIYAEPAEDLPIASFVRQLISHVAAQAK
jgi:hypothetical protein